LLQNGLQVYITKGSGVKVFRRACKTQLYCEKPDKKEEKEEIFF
jgi:hypothetical protein